MKDFKRDVWDKDNLYLEYRPLNYTQILHILHDLGKICNISIDSINDSDIFINISEVLYKAPTLQSINEKNGFKDLCSLLKLDIHQDNTVYVVWNYNEIDKIRVSVLQNYWDYIWYGVSDEMCLLYFSEINILAMITDYGDIRSNLIFHYIQ